MATNVLKVVYTTSDKLSGITLAPGQLIFVEDERSIRFVNADSELINYQSVISLPTELGRTSLQHPYPALYWIKDTNILWRYEDGQWYQLTNPPRDEIIFDDLPAIGESNKLYINGDSIYRYRDNEYKEITSKLSWSSISSD